MSYTVIVVEDESILRASFIRHVDWAACGFSLVCDCASAEEAVAYMAENGFPDLLLTDIRLFKMSGIDLCRYVQDHSPRTKKLLLTGYSDFEYAKQAISHHVDEYLLKPIDPAEMEKILRGYFKQLQASEADGKLLQAAYNDQHRRWETLLSELVCNPSAGVLDGSEAVFSEISSICEKHYTCVCIKYSPRSDSLGPLPAEFLLREFFRNELSLSQNGYLFGVENRRLACLWFCQNTEFIFQKLQSALKSAKHHYPALAFNAGVSLPHAGVAHIRNAYEQASVACRVSASLGDGSIALYPTSSLTPHADGSDWPWDERIISFMSDADAEKALLLVHMQLESIKKGPPIIFDDLQASCVNLITRLYHEISLPERDDVSHMLSEDVLAIMSSTSVDDIERSFEKVFHRYSQAVSEHRSKTSHNAIDIILQYLRQNYASPISLDDLSRVVYLNPRYICSLIKRNTNKTFYEILTEIRIAQACRLLRDPTMKMYEISHAVGFRDTKIFNKSFKRITGQTPSQYRQTLHSSQDIL